MGLTRRSKVSPEFSMASLTDIIFLLLIFFMLTATFVQVKNVNLPVSDSKTVASTDIAVTFERSGAVYVNSDAVPLASLDAAVRNVVLKTENREAATITIIAETGVPFERVAQMMRLASELRTKAIIATQPRN